MASPTSKISLSLSCKKLKNLDTLSKSDPMAVVFQQNAARKWIEVGRTEKIDDDLNPNFTTQIEVNYYFEQIQTFQIGIYDIDGSPNQPLTKHDFLGSTSPFTLHELVGARNSEITRPLFLQKSQHGTINIVAEQVQDSGLQFTFQFSARGLPKMDFLGSCDPYFIISRSRENNTWTPVYKSPVVKGSRKPTYAPFSIEFKTLANGDYDRPLRFDFYDWDRNDSADFIGSFTTNVRSLIGHEVSAKTDFNIINPKKKGKKQKAGVCVLVKKSILRTSTFLDYLRGGVELSVVLAVDFTISNGNPSSPTSLHYVNPLGGGNDYEAAISAVTSILLNYDYDQKLPAFGYGAKIPPNNTVSHCFPLNGNFDDPFVSGTQGAVDAYRSSLAAVTLYGPTIFANIIQKVSTIAQQSKAGGSKTYFTLLILTDGLITDWANTVDAIIEASSLPMSIIIIGIGTGGTGGEAWAKMEELDSDDKKLSNDDGKTAQRDIVQFVSFNEIKEKSGSDISSFPPQLASAVLAELPGQVVEYFKMQNIKPNPPTAAPTSTSTTPA